MNMNPLTLAIISASLILTGCGGGGGGGVKPNNEGGIHNPAPEPPAPSVPELSEVRVGVVDTGFDVAKIDDVIGGYNLHTGSATPSSTQAGHGTAVAGVVNHDNLGNARLDLISVTQDETSVPWSAEVDHAIGLAAERGARVINASFTARHSLPHPSFEFAGISSLDSLQKIVTSNGGLGSVLTVGAGNDGVAIPDVERPVYTDPTIFQRMLLVGGSTDNGNALHEDSNFPGDNPHYRARFLTAPYSRGVDVGSAGTSVAAPRVAAYAAAIAGRWPHLSAREIGDRLLETASAHSPLFSDASCGASGTVNCGNYYLGQGEVDVNAALAPKGAVAVPVGERIDGPSLDPMRSAAQLSGAYGDALKDSGALSDVAVFDELGRDYRIDLGAQVSRADRQRRTALTRRMEQMAVTSAARAQRQDFQYGAFQFTSSVNGHGQTLASRFDGDFGQTTWTLFNFQGDQASPLSAYAESGMMPMLAFGGGSDLTRHLDAVTGLRSAYRLGEKLRLTASHWSGASDSPSALASDYRADRTDIGMDYALTDTLTLSSSLGVLNEREGLAGAQGSAALSLGSDNRMTLGRVNLDYAMGDHLSAFALYEQGRADASGRGLIREISNIGTEEMAFGLQWSGDRHSAALAFRQPMRLTSADALLSVPVGRTLDGQVVTEQRRASLAPSGQQRDIEFGYQLQASQNTFMQLNLMYTLEPGHQADASPEVAGMLNYQYQF